MPSRSHTTTWAMRIGLASDMHHTWRSVTSATSSSSWIRCRSSAMSNPGGVPSISTTRHERTTPAVVYRTMQQKKRVEIGSSSCHSGLTQMAIPASSTPTLCTRSPSTWMYAARRFRSIPSSHLFFFFVFWAP